MDVKETIIDQLRDDQEYYNGIGRNYLSNSNIEMMTRTPELFLKFMRGEYTPETKTHFVLGNAAHTLILEGEEVYREKYNVLDVATRNNKAYNKSEFSRDTILLKKEEELVFSLRDKLFDLSAYHEDIFNLITPFTGEVEVPNILNIDGAQWKLKVDKVTNDCLYDLKTTSDISKFLYVAKQYNYDAQAYLYSTAFKKDMKFIVIDKETLQVSIVDCEKSFLESGRQKIEEASAYYNMVIQPALDGDLEMIKSACGYETLI